VSEEILRLANVHKIYKTGTIEVHALRGVTLSVKRGEFVAIIGPSGSGKSTLLNLVGCLDTPTSGEYRLEDHEVHAMDDAGLARVRNTRIGFVFQSFNLLPKFTARKNVELPLVYAGFTRGERRRRAEEALARVRLSPRVDHRPSELSGGEKQRVAIARALVTEPSILLADEPTGNLDSKVGAEIMGLFGELNAHGSTIVLITHDLSIAARCKRTVALCDGEIVQDTAA
jgi:putative ABC transport system ATP-binding protein